MARFALGFVSGEHAGRIVPLEGDALVGRDERSSIHLVETTVAPRHARLVLSSPGPQVVDLRAPGGTFVDGQRVGPGNACPLRRGSLLRFGEGGPLAVFDEPGALSGGASGLVLRRENGAGGVWDLSQALWIGRGEACDVRLDPVRDAVASSRHLHVTAAFGRAVVTDTGSANGTWIDGRRVVQAVLAPGERLLLGGAEGPSFLVEPASGAHPRGDGGGGSAPTGAPAAPPIPDLFTIRVEAQGASASIRMALKPEVLFGSYAGLNDFETVCFPRELESEADAQERSEAIAPQHGSLVLTEAGVDLVDAGDAPTQVDGARLAPGGRTSLGEVFELSLGGDALGLRGRLFRHPRLASTAPRIGREWQHPVECLVLERKGDEPESRLFVLLVRQATIGSADEAAIPVPRAGVAGHHAMLYVREGSLWISQLGPDPVAVDGVPLSAGTTVPLRVGSSIFIGVARLRIEE